MENNQSSEENATAALTAEWKGGIGNVSFLILSLVGAMQHNRFSITKGEAFHKDDCQNGREGVP